MTAQDLCLGYIVDYEHVPYIVEGVISENEIEVSAIDHAWGKESAHIIELNGIEITQPFLLANGFIKKDDGMFEYVFALSYDIETGILKSVSTDERYPKKITCIHELQRAFWEIGQKSKKFVFKKEFYKGNIKKLVE
jgi:hypothetical protein